MQTIILAAGLGKRMLPLTADTHKCLLPINGKPIIRKQIDTIRSVGLSDVVLATGYKFEMVKAFLKGEVEYVFNPFYETTNSIVSLWLALRGIENDILIINSDVIFDRDLIQRMIDCKFDLSIAVSQNWSDERGYKASIVDGFVKNMGMKIQNVSAEYAGIVFVRKSHLQKLKEKTEKLMVAKQFSIWFEDMIVGLIEDGAEAQAVVVDENTWYEIDTVEELEYARKKFQQTAHGFRTNRN